MLRCRLPVDIHLQALLGVIYPGHVRPRAQRDCARFRGAGLPLVLDLHTERNLSTRAHHQLIACLRSIRLREDRAPVPRIGGHRHPALNCDRTIHLRTGLGRTHQLRGIAVKPQRLTCYARHPFEPPLDLINPARDTILNCGPLAPVKRPIRHRGRSLGRCSTRHHAASEQQQKESDKCSLFCPFTHA